jgi:hypothetical protein
MLHGYQRFFITFIFQLPFLLATTACVKNGKKATNDNVQLPNKPGGKILVAASRPEDGILKVWIELPENGMLLHIKNLPSDPTTTLSCFLDDQNLSPCHDGALLARPEPGDHLLTVTALKNGQKIALGATPKFTIRDTNRNTNVSRSDTDKKSDPLTLRNSDPQFFDQMALPISEDLTIKFELAYPKTSGSCKVETKCQYDSRTSLFWTKCNDDGMSYTVSKTVMALGLQSFSAQASCGNKLGPILTLSWFGVPKDYQPMMLRAVRDRQKNVIVNLVKASDCPSANAQQYECSDAGADFFTPCAKNNVLKAPSAGYRVRLVCEGLTGPILALP